ncbi:MAG TPA: membrane protein insertion efficiency factor YidD [Acholeplasma sp.]|nr:membrane protein insertion efficiency factor YidD [Acholeplasma sp.]
MKKLAIKAIRWYQRNLSGGKMHKCRHNPTCSNYAIEAYEKHNFIYASFLTTKRILTCNPLFKPKYDPVPEPKHKNKAPYKDITPTNLEK